MLRRRLGKSFALAAFLPLMLLLLVPSVLAANAGEHRVNLAAIYSVTAAASLLLFLAYSILVKKKELWLFALFVAVLATNLGYLALSVSRTLEEALLANRIAYFGSALLPLCMLVTVINACNLKHPVWITAVLITISSVVFMLAASPGYLDVYYKEVSLVFVDGTSKLEKVYGPLHCVYLWYLVSYFGGMVGIIIYSALHRKNVNLQHVVILAVVVFLNLSIWAVEQLIHIDLEFLSVSYIVSELLLVLMYALDGHGAVVLPSARHKKPSPGAWKIADFADLTVREKDVLQLLLQNVRRKDMAEQLGVSENTVKKHTSNIFAKLEVASREELLEKVRQMDGESLV